MLFDNTFDRCSCGKLCKPAGAKKNYKFFLVIFLQDVEIGNIRKRKMLEKIEKNQIMPQKWAKIGFAFL